MKITGTFKFSDGTPRANLQIWFILQDPPNPQGDDIIWPGPRSVTTDDAGAFTVESLAMGRYAVRAGNIIQDLFHIDVDETDDKVNIRQIIVFDPAYRFFKPSFYFPFVGANYQISANYFRLRALDTGLFHAWSVIEDSGGPQIEWAGGVAGELPKGIAINLGLNWRIKKGWFQIYNSTRDEWHRVFIENDGAVQVLSFNDHDSEANDDASFFPVIGRNFRLRNNNFQLWNKSTNGFHTVLVTNSQLEIRPED